MRNKGSLVDIDALITCSVTTFPRALVERFNSFDEATQTLLCTQLLYLLNWFREVRAAIFRGAWLILQVVNAFSDQKELEYKRKVLLRLEVPLKPRVCAMSFLAEHCLL